MSETCRTCRFWVSRPPDDRNIPMGDCSRYPPVMVHNGEGEYLGAFFPATHGDDCVCGEWKNGTAKKLADVSAPMRSA